MIVTYSKPFWSAQCLTAQAQPPSLNTKVPGAISRARHSAVVAGIWHFKVGQPATLTLSLKLQVTLQKFEAVYCLHILEIL